MIRTSLKEVQRIERAPQTEEIQSSYERRELNTTSNLKSRGFKRDKEGSLEIQMSPSPQRITVQQGLAN